MTREEVKYLLITMKSLYPNFKTDDLTFTIDAWHKLLAHDEPDLMMNALYKYSRTSGSAFAPTAAQLLELVAEDSVKTLEEGEIRAMLNKAARNANYGSVEEFYSLPPDLQDAVGSPAIIQSWGMMESGLDNELTRVIRAYNQNISRRKKQIVTPEGLNLNLNNRLVSTNNLLSQVKELRKNATLCEHLRTPKTEQELNVSGFDNCDADYDDYYEEESGYPDEYEDDYYLDEEEEEKEIPESDGY